MEFRKSGLLPTDSPAIARTLREVRSLALDEPPESPTPRGGRQ